ncbi:3-hydroxyacyl-CoA dehydrogenase NAD-binding domain-containing protein [Thermogutta sp.]|uniref:3-hydroxyacyl-CoA dehydrogenase n=1 Tax=Thermogutta sp. TaxID=1962930 RepID=UPI003C7E1E7B
MTLPAIDPEVAIKYLASSVRLCFQRATSDEGGISDSTFQLPDRFTSQSLTAVLEGVAQNTPTSFSRIGIVGAGLMGISIAACHLRRGCEVSLYDNAQQALEASPQRVRNELELQIDDPALVSSFLSHLHCVSDPHHLADCTCVIEAVPENLSLKRGLFKQLEELVPPDCVFLTNTSTIPVSRLAEDLRRPQRLAGLHFLHPVRERPVVEVICHSETARSIAASVMRQALALGKLPLAVSDSPGFVVNRLLFAYLNEALELLASGAGVATLDESAVRVGFAMGPLRIMDEIGLDTIWGAGRILWEAFPDRIEASPILVTLLKHKRLGRKTGQGFYRYGDLTPRTASPESDPEIEKLLAPWVTLSSTPSSEHIGERLLAAMTAEALSVAQENVVSDWRMIDVAAVLGLGFPARYGGPLHLAASQHPAAFLEWMTQHLSKKPADSEPGKFAGVLASLREHVSIAPI